jgi:hypothetical protein
MKLCHETFHSCFSGKVRRPVSSTTSNVASLSLRYSNISADPPQWFPTDSLLAQIQSMDRIAPRVVLWRPCSFTPIHSPLVQWVNHMLPAQRGSDSRPGDAPTHTMEPGSVSNVMLHWWPWRDPWSPATLGPLCLWSCDDFSCRLP